MTEAASGGLLGRWLGQQVVAKTASPALHAFAAKTTPTLREHLAIIEKAKPAIEALK